MGKKALVVEYEPRYVQRLTGTLQEQDYEVAIAKDGEEALSKAKEWMPDVIFLSAVLPKLRSSEVIQGIRGIPGLAGVRIILLATGVKEEAIEAEKKKKSVDGILCKPFSETRIIDTLSLMKAAAPPPPPPPAPPPREGLLDLIPKQEKKLTSEDLFGDFIEEEGKPGAVPPAAPVSATSAPAPKPAPPKEEKGADVDALLHKTLSGLAAPKPRRTEATAAKLGSDMDRKLSETLSGLDLSSRPRKTEGAVPPPPPPPPAPQPPSPPRSSGPVPPKPVTAETHPPVEGLKPLAPKPEAPAPAPPQAAPRPTPQEAGERYGNYLLVEKLGTGGMAEIWKAKMQGVEGFQKQVAIKRILPQFSHNQEFTTMFIDEAKLAAQLSHRNIVHIYDLGKLEDSYFIAMEYVEGTDLRRVNLALRERAERMPVPLALFILSQMASALDYAHKRRDGDGRDLNIVHRDVSPQNILLSKDGEVKICDFGIAKAASKASHTRAGSLKGKLQYMSPEQAWGKAVDYRSDIFSLAVVLYEMLAGKPLFEGDSELSILEKVRHPKVDPPSRLRPDLPKEIDDIVLKALQEEPDARYTDAAHLFRELDDVIQHYAPRVAEKTVAQFLTALAHKGTALPAFSYTAPPEPAAAEPPRPAPAPAPPKVEPAPAPPAPPKAADGPPAPSGRPEEERRKGKKGKGRDRHPERAPEEEKPKVKFEEKKPEPPPAKPADIPVPEKRVPSFLDTGKGAVEEEEKKKSPLVFVIAGAAALVLIILGVVFMGGKKETLPAPAPAPAPQEVPAPVEPALPTPDGPQPKPAETKPAPAPVVETPKPAPVVEQPKPQEPAPAPVVETPKPAPVVEQPKPQEPAPTPPVAEQPKPAPAPPVETPKPAPPQTPIEPPAAKYKTGDLVALGTPGLNPPAVVKKASPSYPPIAKMQKVQGDVTVQVLVDESGRVTSTNVLTGPNLLGNAAQDAAKQYLFVPATIDGVKVKCYYNIVFNFRL